MPPHHPLSPPITLIVATTPLPPTLPNGPLPLGIGLNGTLPWPRIKADMSFFARVTARPPAPSGTSGAGTGGTRTNAVIMGRKTYDSIPVRLRPLGKRVNVVISRDVDGGVARRVREELEGKLGREWELARGKAVAAAQAQVEAHAQAQVQGQEGSTATMTATATAPEGQTNALVSSSLSSALSTLSTGVTDFSIGNIYVIGGAEIYSSLLKIDDGRKVRIVMTDVEKVDGGAFECDTVFPLDGGDLEGGSWRRVSAEEVSGWVGEEVTGEWVVEGDVRVRMVGYERKD
ncbi:dihydrofolate reductase-like domain-containing protein [Aspergillus crustosus]